MSVGLLAEQKKHYNATVVGVKIVTDDLRILRVEPDTSTSFEPGQFTTLGLLSGEPCMTSCELQDKSLETLFKRAYSISHPLWDEKNNRLYGAIPFFEFYVTLVRKKDPGEKPPTLTPRLFGLTERSRIFFGKITGHYRLIDSELQHRKHLIFCATGTGEAPHNAQIWKLLSEGYTGRITSIVCVRKSQELAYRRTYVKLIEKFPQLTYICLTTQEANQPKRYIQDLLESGDLEKQLGEKLSPEKHSFFLCGNPNMIGIPKHDGNLEFPTGRPGMIELLMKRGFVPDRGIREIGQIHFEKFW